MIQYSTNLYLEDYQNNLGEMLEYAAYSYGCHMEDLLKIEEVIKP